MSMRTSPLFSLWLRCCVAVGAILVHNPLWSQYMPGGATPLLWFDANQGITLGATDNVASWQTLAGSEEMRFPAATPLPGYYSLSQGTAGNRPNVRDTALWLPNKALHFVRANNDVLSVVDRTRIPTVNDNSADFAEKMFTVAFSLASLPSQRMIIFKEGTQTVGINLFIETTNRLVVGVWNSAGTFKSTQSAVLTVNTKYIATVVFKSQIASLYLNGTYIGQTAALGANLATHTPSRYSLGGNDGDGTRYNGTTANTTAASLNGHIAEFIYSDNVANDAIRTMWENYLSEKYTITLGADRFVSPLTGYNNQVAGIGRVDASNIVNEMEYGCAGLYLRNLTNIVDDGDYLLVGHNNGSGFTSTGTNMGRLNREWMISSTNGGGSGEGNVTLMFDPVEEGSTTTLLNPYDYAVLIDGVQTYLHQGYIESGRVCFDVSVSAVKNKKISLASVYTVNYINFRYQPGGTDLARFWYTASGSQFRLRKGRSAVQRIYDQSIYGNDARPSAVAQNILRFTDILPSYTKNGLGTGSDALEFNVASTSAGGDVMHVLTSTDGQPDQLNGILYDTKTIIAFFQPTNATTFTGNQVLYDQGTAVDGFGLYLNETGGVRKIYTAGWRNNGSDFNIYHNTNLVNDNTTRYLLSWTFSRINYARVYSYLNGAQFGSTLIGGGSPPYELRAIAGDNVGIGGIYNGFRHHTDAVGAITSATGERIQAYVGDILHYTGDLMSLRRIVENSLAAKYNHALSTPLFNLTAAGAAGCTYELIGIGREAAVPLDEVTSAVLPSGGLFLTNVAFVQNDLDYLLLAHNNKLGTRSYNSGNGILWNKTWYVDLSETTVNGGNIKLSFAIDQEGSDRQLYQIAQYFIRDSTNGVEIGLGAAVLNTVSSTDRRVEFTINASTIADRLITLGVKDRTIPVQCDCVSAAVDDDSDGKFPATDPDCANRWGCAGDFTFTEFAPGGDPDQATSLRKMTIGGGTVSYTDVTTSSALRKVDAAGYNRRDGMVYGFINEGAYINNLVRIQSDGTLINMGVPLAGSTTFPAGASQFIAGDGIPSGTKVAYAFANNATITPASPDRYVGIVQFNTFTRPTVTHYNKMAFSAPAGVPNFKDMIFDPSIAFNTNVTAYAYDVNEKKMITINVETGVATRLSASAQGYDDIEALFFTEFGELYGWGVLGSNREFVHINKGTGVVSTPIVATAADLNQIDACGCGNGLSIRVYPVATNTAAALPVTTSNSNTNAYYRVDIINATGSTITGLRFQETFLPAPTDGRQFVAFTRIGTVTQPSISINGGAVGVTTFSASSSIDITGLQALAGTGTAPVTASFILTVSIPTDLSNTTVYTQPLLSNLPAQVGTSKSSDYVITTNTNSEYVVTNVTLRDATPLIITTPFPVEWASFDATPEGERVLLEWSTFREENNAYFTVERSAGGETWTAIGELPGAGNSSDLRWYSFYDVAPLAGINYYRIRQTDIDGKTEVSEIRTVTFTGGTTLGLRSYPNPAAPDELLNVQFVSDLAGVVFDVQLLDLTGRVLLAEQLPANEGTNMIQIPLQALAKGIYLIRVENEKLSATQRLIIR